MPTSEITVTIEYDGGIDSELDAKLRALGANYGAKAIGSGCALDGACTRDIEFSGFASEENKDAFTTEARDLVRASLKGTD